MKVSCLRWVLVLLFVSVGFASSWQDPPFEEMVENSDLIAVCEVVEGGMWMSKVKVLNVLKGEKPEDLIRVGEYNNAYWPADAVKKEALKEGEEYLLFLKYSKHVFAELTIHPALEEELKRIGIPTEDADIFRARHAERTSVDGFKLPSPSTGDYPVKENMVYGSWYRPSYPHYAPPIPLQIGLPLIQGLIRQQAGQNVESSLTVLQEALTPQLVQKIKTPKKGEEYSKNAMADVALLEWLMCAQAVFGDSKQKEAILLSAKHDWYLIRTFAARAMRSLPETPETLRTMEALVLSPESPVQKETAHSLMEGEFTAEKVEPFLLKALKNASPHDAGPASIMDPVRNVDMSGQESLIRAVTHFGLAKQAEDILVSILERDKLPNGSFYALRSHFLTYPSEKAFKSFIKASRKADYYRAEGFAHYFFEEKSQAALQELKRMILDKEFAATDQSDWLKRLYVQYGIQHPVLNEILDQFRTSIHDEYLTPGILALWILRWNEEDTQHILKTFSAEKQEKQKDRFSYSSTVLSDFELVDCFQYLALYPLKKEVVDDCLQFMLEHHPNSRHVLSCILLWHSSSALKWVEGLKNEDAEVIREAISFIRTPPDSPEKKVDGWMNFIDQESHPENIEAFWFYLALVGAERPAYLERRLRDWMKRDPRTVSKSLHLLEVIGVELTEAEKNTMEEGIIDAGPIPELDWTREFRKFIKRDGHLSGSGFSL